MNPDVGPCTACGRNDFKTGQGLGSHFFTSQDPTHREYRTRLFGEPSPAPASNVLTVPFVPEPPAMPPAPAPIENPSPSFLDSAPATPTAAVPAWTAPATPAVSRSPWLDYALAAGLGVGIAWGAWKIWEHYKRRRELAAKAAQAQAALAGFQVGPGAA